MGGRQRAPPEATPRVIRDYLLALPWFWWILVAYLIFGVVMAW